MHFRQVSDQCQHPQGLGDISLDCDYSEQFKAIVVVTRSCEQRNNNYFAKFFHHVVAEGNGLHNQSQN